MIGVNKNILSLKQSATLVINQKVKELRANGVEVYHFGFGQSPFPIYKTIVKALTKNATCNHYLPTQGLPELQQCIAYFLERYQDVKMPVESIFIGPGSKEFLYQIILLLDGVFFIPQGSWVSYVPQIKSKGATYNILETTIDSNYKLTAAVLERACKSYLNIQKSLILNSPNNPTGAVYNDDELREIAQICKRYNVIVFSDEIYSQINFKETFSPSISRYYPERTIVFGGLSKVFSAGGYRLGFVAVSKTMNQLYLPFKALISETFSCVSAPVQYAAIKAFEFGDDIQNYVSDCTSILNHIAIYIYKQLTAVNIICTKPQGAFYMLVDFKNYRKQLAKLKIYNAAKLTQYLLENYRVALLPGTDFYFPKDSLTCRLATVDFDGAKVYRAFKANKDLNTNFIHNNTPLIYKGLKQIAKFLKSIN